MSFLSSQEIKNLGFLSTGDNLSISKKASFYGAGRIKIGNNVRIDDFCIISAGTGGIEIGNYVHIAAYSSLMGDANISLEDFSGLSSRVSVYSSSDDYSGESLTNPTIPKIFKKINSKNVTIGRHVIIGSGSVVLPGVTISEGSAIGALSLVSKSCEPFFIYAGNPARKIKKRKNFFLDLELKLKQFNMDNDCK